MAGPIHGITDGRLSLTEPSSRIKMSAAKMNGRSLTNSLI